MSEGIKGGAYELVEFTQQIHANHYMYVPCSIHEQRYDTKFRLGPRTVPMSTSCLTVTPLPHSVIDKKVTSVQRQLVSPVVDLEMNTLAHTHMLF